MGVLRVIVPKIALTDDETVLMQNAVHDAAAFAPIYERYAGRIYGYCLRQMGDPAEAEDLTSQVFIQALGALHGYRGGSVGAWLFRIAHNLLMSHYRRKRRSGLAFDDSAEPTAMNALQNLIISEQAARLRAALTKLSADQRELIALRVDGGLSAREIGQIVGKREGTVRVALHRIFAVLRAELQETEETDV